MKYIVALLIMFALSVEVQANGLLSRSRSRVVVRQNVKVVQQVQKVQVVQVKQVQQVVVEKRNEADKDLVLQTVSESLPKADIVLANILAGPLHELASSMANLVVPNGALVLSGILKDQAVDLARTYSAWFDMDEPVFRDDWARLTGRRR